MSTPPAHHTVPQNATTLGSLSQIAPTNSHGNRSINFSDQVHERRAMDTESSADEQTAIVPHERRGNRHYSTIANRRKSSQESRGGGAAGQHAATTDGAAQADGSAEGEGEEPPKLSWWKSILDKYGSVELKNKGSVARDHLALERTFLAWLRTSLSFASIGIAVTQLFRLDQTLAKTPHDHPRVQNLRHVGKPLGATFLGVGILVLLIGFHRYFESQHYVMLGKFPASRGSVALVAFCAGALTVASLVVVLTIAPGVLT